MLLHARKKGLGMRLVSPTNHQSAALIAIFIHRWSCGLVASACTYAMGGEIFQHLWLAILVNGATLINNASM